LVEIYNIQIEKRPLQKTDKLGNDPFLMYDYGSWQEDVYEGFKPGYPKKTFTHKYYFDANKPTAKYETYEPYVKFNGSLISVDEIETTSYERPGKINELYSRNGSLVTIAYQMCNIEYNIEQEALTISNSDHFLYPLSKAKYDYELALSQLDFKMAQADLSDDNSSQSIETARTAVRTAYNNYIIALIDAQQEDLRRKGVIE
jgi:hypothetical protein